ncbi:oocyte zinc finger protein XlCOF28-like [Toxorhynchites rutilus septentrionalis]|uniref:oocyte zinc finger protein XlCOF28-like n=1 Tax=Toxorhynchites rutilus septentrionalis TaxID=329112 RepID=UPI002478701E|nr:oocyte zinc finger protein XlCOF28-like [Toxorhynchites rutilus septentrionalis]
MANRTVTQAVSPGWLNGSTSCFIPGCSGVELAGKRDFFNMSFGDLRHWWRSTAWVAKYNTELPDDARICDRHFEERFIDRTRKKPRLLVGTIPTLGLEILEQVNDKDQQSETNQIDLYCRLCAKKMKRPMKFQLEQLGNMKTIIECCLGKYKTELGLPSGVCYDCMAEVTHFSEFAKKCEQSQSQLLQLVRMEASKDAEVNSSNAVPSSANKENNLANATRTEQSMDESLCINADADGTQHCPGNTVSDNREQSRSKPFRESCSECDKAFSNPQSYHAHIKAHAVMKQHLICHICDKRFHLKRELRIHLESVHGGKRFECHICGKVVNWQKTLASHMREHSRDLKYTCTVCDTSFPSSAKLKLHQSTAHGRERFKCGACDASYWSDKMLARHKERAHNVDPISDDVNVE